MILPSAKHLKARRVVELIGARTGPTSWFGRHPHDSAQLIDHIRLSACPMLLFECLSKWGRKEEKMLSVLEAVASEGGGGGQGWLQGSRNCCNPNFCLDWWPVLAARSLAFGGALAGSQLMTALTSMLIVLVVSCFGSRLGNKDGCG